MTFALTSASEGTFQLATQDGGVLPVQASAPASAALPLSAIQVSNLNSPIALSGTPTVLAAWDLQSQASGLFLVTVSVTWNGGATDVHTLALNPSFGITAPFAGGAQGNTLGTKARYLNGAAITGGTGGTGYGTSTAVAKTAVGAGVAVTETLSALINGTPGQRIGVELIGVATTGSQMQNAGINAWAWELPSATTTP